MCVLLAGSGRLTPELEFNNKLLKAPPFVHIASELGLRSGAVPGLARARRDGHADTREAWVPCSYFLLLLDSETLALGCFLSEVLRRERQERFEETRTLPSHVSLDC